YADAQMDPRTGEILHAQVYMTSAFAFGSKNSVRRLLRMAAENKDELKSMFLPMGESGRLCDREEHGTFEYALQEVLVADLSDEAILKISQDYIREVV